MTNNIYTCKTFAGFYPVGTAAVVVAKDNSMATSLLNSALEKHGLIGDVKESELIILDTSKEQVLILNDGEY